MFEKQPQWHVPYIMEILLYGWSEDTSRYLQRAHVLASHQGFIPVERNRIRSIRSDYKLNHSGRCRNVPVCQTFGWRIPSRVNCTRYSNDNNIVDRKIWKITQGKPATYSLQAWLPRASFHPSEVLHQFQSSWTWRYCNWDMQAIDGCC